jgi:hypothetical protein
MLSSSRLQEGALYQDIAHRPVSTLLSFPAQRQGLIIYLLSPPTASDPFRVSDQMPQPFVVAWFFAENRYPLFGMTL